MESSEDDDRMICFGVGNQDTDRDSYIQRMEDKEAQDEKDYTVLTESDIGRLQEESIAAVCGVLSVSKAVACLLLRRYNWSPLEVYEVWFADEERTRKAVGLASETAVTLIRFSSGETECGICFERYSAERIYAAGCGHPFCEGCWRSYIRTAVSEGPGCLTLRCPEPSCGSGAVGLDMVESLVAAEDKKRYDQFLLRSYVEERKNCKWCPAPGCVFAVEYAFEGDGADYSVTCNCSYSFCWKCTEESHRPVDCEMVGNWIEKNAIESDNTRWILAFTKPCPKCKRPIEKNSGCNRMTCRPPCNFVFCWLCLSDWDVHGYRSCNGYKATEESRNAQEIAQKYLHKYTHYYERWASNDRSKQKAISDLKDMENEHMEELINPECRDKMMIGVVIAAWKQIIKCRRILKWSYLYGYYLPETDGMKKQFFEYLQGQAESALERLHHCAERGLKKYLKKGGSSKNFSCYRLKLKGLTNTTRNYFENLAQAFENGLSEVNSGASHSAETTKKPSKRRRTNV